MSRLSDLADAVHTELDDATVEKVLYRRREGRNAKRRRVHWYAEGGRLEAPDQAGGRLDGEGNRIATVWTRWERVACQVFAESVETVETLLENLIVSIDHVAPNGSAILQEYTWDYDQVAQRVPRVELIFEVNWPTRDEQKALVTITDEELTCEFEEE